LTMIAVITVVVVLAFGAMMLPGFLLTTLFDDLKHFSIIDLPMIFLVFVSQLVVMRHFQVIMSRWMAVKLLRKRIEELKTDVLAKLDELESVREGEKKEARLEDLKRRFYSIAIYDLIGSDVLGHFPVYLVGLRLRYVLDEDVIEHIKSTTAKSQEIMEKSKDELLTRERWTASIKETEEGFRAEFESRPSTKRKKE
jgi:energy-coupling factor transporter transmembrane protein EcfT